MIEYFKVKFAAICSPCVSLGLFCDVHAIHYSHRTGARSKKAEAAAAASGGMESGESQMKLIERPRDYSVVFSFPEVLQ